LTEGEVLRSGQERLSDISRDTGEWKRGLSDAIREIGSRVELPALQNTEEISGTSGTQSYDLTSEISNWSFFDRVIGRPYWDKHGLDFLNKADFDGYYYDGDCKGTPQFYIIYEDELRIAPQPQDDETLYFPWQRIAIEISDIPDRYKDVVVTCLCKNMVPKGETRYALLVAEFEMKIARYKGQVDFKAPSFEHDIYKQRRQEIITDLDR